MGLERGWAHRTPNLSALSYRFAVRTESESLGRQLDALLAGLRDPVETAPVEHWYSLTAADASDGAVDVRRDGDELAHGQQPGDAMGWLVWDVNRAAAEAGGDHLLFHAGGIEADGTGVLLPGASGSGKSTLVAGLVRGGLGYLSDELVALNMATGRLMPYAKPITVKPGSFAVLSDMSPDVCLEPGLGPWAGQEWQVAVGDGTGRRIGRPCVPGFVVLPRYDSGAETALTPLSETEAFFALAVNAVNLIHHGSEGTRALGRLAKRCRCFSLTVSDLDEACRLVLELVVPRAEASAGGVGRAP
jgi:HprK-related kinase A